MRKLSFALSALLLLSPIAASAAFSTPGELMSAIQTGEARSFSLTAHAGVADGTYVSVWANGTQQGTDSMTMQMTSKATVDVVLGDMKIRIRAELMTVDGTLYLKLTDVEGSFKNAFAMLTATLQQHKWIALPFDEAMLKDMVGGPAFSVSSATAMEADSMFTVTSVTGKNGTTYTLALTQDTAAQLALSLREMLQDTDSVSDDFFPWRDLAEGLRFEMTMQMNPTDQFVSSTYSMSTKGTKSYFSLTGSEKVATALRLTAPAGAVTIDEAMSMFGDFPTDFMPMPSLSSGPMMEEEMSPSMDMMMDESSSPSMNMMMVDEMVPSDADCSGDDAMVLLMNQRNGLCPVVKTTTRHRGW